MEPEDLYYGRVAYDAYCESVGGVSKFTGDKLPEFYDQDPEIKLAWVNAARAVRQLAPLDKLP